MNASDVDRAYRDWLKQGLNRQGYDNTGLAAAWGLERTAVSKVLSGVRRLLVVNANASDPAPRAAWQCPCDVSFPGGARRILGAVHVIAVSRHRHGGP